jgi:hypothetical protein
VCKTGSRREQTSSKQQAPKLKQEPNDKCQITNESGELLESFLDLVPLFLFVDSQVSQPTNGPAHGQRSTGPPRLGFAVLTFGPCLDLDACDLELPGTRRPKAPLAPYDLRPMTFFCFSARFWPLVRNFGRALYIMFPLPVGVCTQGLPNISVFLFKGVQIHRFRGLGP